MKMQSGCVSVVESDNRPWRRVVSDLVRRDGAGQGRMPVDGEAEPSSYRLQQDDSFEEIVIMKTSSRLLVGCVWALALVMALLSYGCAV